MVTLTLVPPLQLQWESRSCRFAKPTKHENGAAVIPAKAGIQVLWCDLDPRLRGVTVKTQAVPDIGLFSEQDRCEAVDKCF